MDATPGFGVGNEQVSQLEQDALYNEFMTRAAALPQGAIAGADALVADIALSELSEATFSSLAATIATATGLDAPVLKLQIEKGRNAHLVAAGANQWPQLPPGLRLLEAIPKSMNEAQALVEMNARFAYVHQAGEEGAVLYFGPKTVELRLLKDLQQGLANCFVLVKSIDRKGNEETEMVPAITWWRKHPQRRSYERTAFRPYRSYQPDGAPLPIPVSEDEFNLWTGFQMVPRRGSWPCLRWHLWAVICRRDRKNFKYLLRWLAHLVQHPYQSPGVVVVLMSQREGTGKTTIGEVLSRMVGARHAITLRTPEDMLGNFNGHLARCIFILLDEMSFPGEHAQTRKLKSVITASTWTINEKYKRPYEIPNVSHILLTTNASWAVNAGDLARRFFVLDVDDSRAGDRKYFALLRAEMDQGGIEAMLYDLNRIVLDGWHPHHDLPRTRALSGQQVMSSGVYTRWGLDAAINGGFVIKRLMETMELDPTVWGKDHPTAVITAAIQHFAHAATIREPVTSIATGRWLARCGFARRVVHGAPVWAIPDQAAFLQAVRREGGIT